MNCALITGICGQDGSYLAELLVKKGYKVIGLDRKNISQIPSYLQKLAPKIVYVKKELTDPTVFESLVKKYHPDEIYNLAAISSLKEAWSDPLITSEVNGLAPQRIYEAVRLFQPACRVFQASSSEIFGKPTTSPQDEFTPLNPNNPYGVAKVFAHQMAKIYREKYKLFICCGILFNHESPRRPLNFVTAKIAYGAACAKLGIRNSKELNEEREPIVKNGKIALGNLDAQRDWSYAGDFVNAMYLMLQREQPDDYVLGSGKLHSIAQFCDAAFSHVGLDYKDYVTMDSRFIRPSDPILIVSNPSKAETSLSWKRDTGFEELVNMIVDSHLAALRARMA